jgi:hypothetical protein
MSPQLRVPTIAVPNGMILRPRRTEGGKTLPIFRPLPQGSCSKPIGRTKKMNVIGHNHIPANKPCIASLPGVDNHRGAILECKNGFAIMAANREINNYRFIVAVNYRRVRQMFAAYVGFSGHLGIRRAISKFWAPTKRRPPWEQVCKSHSSVNSVLEGHASSCPKLLSALRPNFDRCPIGH